MLLSVCSDIRLINVHVSKVLNIELNGLYAHVMCMCVDFRKHLYKIKKYAK